MSKAFTRESDEANDDEIVPRRARVPPGTKRYITENGVDRLRQQAGTLLEEKRALTNGGNLAGNETTTRIRRLDAAIQRIQQVLGSVVVAEPPGDSRKVGFGAFVRVRDSAGEEENYQIVGSDEADPNQGRISSISPLARALMNRSPGDTVRFRSPAGEQELSILAVHY